MASLWELLAACQLEPSAATFPNLTVTRDRGYRSCQSLRSQGACAWYTSHCSSVITTKGGGSNQMRGGGMLRRVTDRQAHILIQVLSLEGVET